MASGLEISIEQSTPLRELRKTMRKAYNVLTDIEDLAEEELFPHARQHAQKAYSTKGEAIGKPWADYSDEPAYRAFKASVIDRFDGYDDYDQSKIMSAMPGSLMRWAPESEEWLYPSLTQTWHPMQIRKASNATLTASFGTSVSYASRLTETGGTNPFGESYPARPIFNFNRTQRFSLSQDIDSYYHDRLQEEGVID